MVFIMTLITSVVLKLTYPYMNKLIFNAMEYRDKELFQRAAIICVILVVLNCLAPYRRYLQIRIVRKVVFDIKIKLFEKLMKMDMDYYEKHHSGEALKTLNWDADSLKDSYFSHVFWVGVRMVNVAASIIAMLIYSPILMAVSLSFCFIIVSISICINKQIKELEKKLQNKVSRLTTRLSDILLGFTELKMYSGSSIVLDNFYVENEKVLMDEKQRYGKAAKLEVESFLLGFLASFGTIGVGAYMVACGQLDYGTVMAIVSLQMGVSASVQSLGSALTTFSASLVKAGRVFDFLELDCEEAQDEGILELRKDAFPIEVKNVTFSYDGQRNVLMDFSFRLTEGEKVMLMGESGCGKSTLLKLIMGFYKKDAGSIKVYGREMDTCFLFRLRQLITYVPQSSYLFAGTVRENIGVGKQQATDEEIMHAARMAYADEFIRTLPEGYDTCLDAGGTNLSVGQKQRIALARAFLKDSPILLMDEPSSALDIHSEQMLLQAMEVLMKNKTVIMVTHRSTLSDAFDQIVCIR